jgi:glucokinase
MVRQAREALEAGRPSVMREWFPDELSRQKLTAADLSKSMDEGDELAGEIIRRAGILLGRSLAAAVTLFSPEAVIIGGGGALADERIMVPLRNELRSRLLPDARNEVQILTAERNEDAGIIGSALHAKIRLT